MKILFTGGGTGGHFYPIIAVAEAVREEAKRRKIIEPELYYMAPSKYNPRALYDNGIRFVRIPAGKVRRYFSILNITDALKTLIGCLAALIRMYSIYPDVVFGKGGYASFPALLAAKILRIPVVIHESDSKPGRVNAWAGRFARRIALSYPDAAKYFKYPERVAYTGNPIRTQIATPLSNGAHEYLDLEQDAPVILFLGGSQGSQTINDILLGALPELLERHQIIHQTGKANFESMKAVTALVLKDHPFSHRYHPFDYLNELALRMAAGAADIVVSRAGSTIFEIAAWGRASIIIPLPESVAHDQIHNAFSYARSGAASVIEENNLSPHVLIGEIDRISSNPQVKGAMMDKARSFAKLDAASHIAQAVLDIAVEHED